MIDLECPMCEATLPVALDAAALRCGGCSIVVEIDAAEVRELAIAA